MILVFGKTGQVARELQSYKNIVALGRDQADLTNPGSCCEAIKYYLPSAVIIAAAYTDVDNAENEENLANLINGEAPTAMAGTCAKLDIPIIYISTDYVFKGHGIKPRSPNEVTKPQNAYGRSKLLGENGVIRSGATYAILRTSWIISSYSKNFLKTMIKLSESHKEIKVISDQIGGPTPAHDIADSCIKIANALQRDSSKSGCYHLSGTPNISWASFAKSIFMEANKDIKVISIKSSDYKTSAIRPMNSRLNCTKIENIFGIKRPKWRKSLNIILTNLEN